MTCRWLGLAAAFALTAGCGAGSVSPPPLNTGSPPRLAGTITEFSNGVGDAWGMTLGPDRNVWFTDYIEGAIGRITPGGAVTKFPLDFGSLPFDITPGADGALWFSLQSSIGRITTTGKITTYGAGTIGAGNAGAPDVSGITLGPDGNVWFTEYLANRIGKITPAGVITEYGTGITPNARPIEIAAGPDGNLWFTEHGTDTIGRITPAGVVTEFTAGITRPASPTGITAGPDGNMWFTEQYAGRIGRITPNGTITEFPIASGQFLNPYYIAQGPDGNLWFTEFDGGRVVRITTSGEMTPFPSQGRLSSPRGIVAGSGGMWFAENGKVGLVQ